MPAPLLGFRDRNEEGQASCNVRMLACGRATIRTIRHPLPALQDVTYRGSASVMTDVRRRTLLAEYATERHARTFASTPLSVHRCRRDGAMAKLPPPQINLRWDISPNSKLDCPFRMFMTPPRVAPRIRMHSSLHERRESRWRADWTYPPPVSSILNSMAMWGRNARRRAAPWGPQVLQKSLARYRRERFCKRGITRADVHTSYTSFLTASRHCDAGAYRRRRGDVDVLPRTSSRSASVHLRAPFDVLHLVETRRSCLCAITNPIVSSPRCSEFQTARRKDGTYRRPPSKPSTICLAAAVHGNVGQFFSAVDVRQPIAFVLDAGRSAIQRAMFLSTCSASIHPRLPASNAAICRLTFTPAPPLVVRSCPRANRALVIPRTSRREDRTYRRPASDVSTASPHPLLRDPRPSSTIDVGTDRRPTSNVAASDAMYDRAHARFARRGSEALLSRGRRMLRWEVMDVLETNESRRTYRAPASSVVEMQPYPTPSPFSSPHLSSSDVTPLRCVALDTSTPERECVREVLEVWKRTSDLSRTPGRKQRRGAADPMQPFSSFPALFTPSSSSGSTPLRCRDVSKSRERGLETSLRAGVRHVGSYVRYAYILDVDVLGVRGETLEIWHTHLSDVKPPQRSTPAPAPIHLLPAHAPPRRLRTCPSTK
ncbi:hypothetical protein SCHPADRAFT_947635 [Schizopora paradoxa]|uniref:Uncharacterized protein n=1 Tax=Schizopora paradoxa TaxID=27342 RepID=A0A0H2QYQ6_9AGAM|nr:hypothetical protein SCHPADRAFT_947635 [Schizopora paradoxa]